MNGNLSREMSIYIHSVIQLCSVGTVLVHPTNERSQPHGHLNTHPNHRHRTVGQRSCGEKWSLCREGESQPSGSSGIKIAAQLLLVLVSSMSMLMMVNVLQQINRVLARFGRNVPLR